MTKYAIFDPTAPAPQPVLGVVDVREGMEPPAADARIEVTDEQWEALLYGRWEVADGKLVAKRMPRWASFDHNQPAPQDITGWYDEAHYDYGPNGEGLPDPLDRFPITDDAIWEKRTEGHWQIAGGKMMQVERPRPVPTTRKQLAEHGLNGPVTVRYAIDPSLNADYRLNMGDLTQAAAGVAAGLGLPSGEDTLPLTDVAGVAHAWPEAGIVALARAYMRYRYRLTLVLNETTETDAEIPEPVLTI